MSSGKEHDRACLKLSAIALVGAFVVEPQYKDLIVCAAIGSGLGLILNPDLDLKGNARRRWGKVGLGWVWGLYDWAIPHRSFLSHGPVIGTVGRIGYLGVVFTGCIYIMSYLSPYLPVFTFPWEPQNVIAQSVAWILRQNPDHLLGLFAGLAVADALHSLMDLASSADKRRKYRSNR